ncbi:MAG: type II secretion system protein [Candidatus Cloacimonadales bacterium]|jgi:type II secretory pathway pseudopilin PulG|nr:type II secretion system GspH family protein [Candidatus Cloacimonadota bacterium]MDY0381380.1 type II secretion system protein [Candidatus Cloacimonadaceae bacterium]MCB5256528.1 type II secretion system GspH family protein [Candidatus Cloacimonadota bacterium]MCB5264452.1 type II secretion system GspH family protein [Candidatus Cloacimonadota bacterium]MCB5277021.1 type II secretion system GspH family protein [Candidatus Cloacimonadota bacterium]
MIKNEKGSTLIELIAVMIMSLVLITVSAVGVITFYNSYTRIKKNLDLQQGLMECIHILRHGLLMPARDENLMTVLKYSPTSKEYWSIATAKKVEIKDFNSSLGYGTKLRLMPAISSMGQDLDYLEYYLDDGVIRAQYIYNGSRVPSPLHIFPHESEKDFIEVTRFELHDANTPLSAGAYYTPTGQKDNIPLVKVVIEAQALLKDARVPRDRVYETVVYETYIANKYSTE